MYKIGVSGSSGTGKTTFVNEFSKQMKTPVIPEMAKEVFKEFNIQSPRELVNEAEKIKFQVRITELMVLAQKSHPEFITDRTGADSAAYWLVFNAQSASVEQTAKQLEICEALCRELDYVLLFPPKRLPVLEDDGVRSLNPFYQLKIYLLIKGLLEYWGIPYFETKETDNPKLVDTILHNLKSPV